MRHAVRPLLVLLFAIIFYQIPVHAQADRWDAGYDNTYRCFGYKIHVFIAPHSGSGMITFRDREDVIRSRFLVEGVPSVDSCEKDPLGIGLPVVVISAYTGDAHCCQTVSYWSLGDQPVNLLTYEKGDDYSTDLVTESWPVFKDLDGDGIREIITTDNSMEFFPSCFACQPPLWDVFCYDGHRYQLCSGRFSDFIIHKANKVRQALRLEIAEYEKDGEKYSPMNCISLADTYYGFFALLNQGEIGLEKLKKMLPRNIYRAVLKDKAEIDRRVAFRIERMKWHN